MGHEIKKVENCCLRGKENKKSVGEKPFEEIMPKTSPELEREA